MFCFYVIGFSIHISLVNSTCSTNYSRLFNSLHRYTIYHLNGYWICCEKKLLWKKITRPTIWLKCGHSVRFIFVHRIDWPWTKQAVVIFCIILLCFFALTYFISDNVMSLLRHFFIDALIKTIPNILMINTWISIWQFHELSSEFGIVFLPELNTGIINKNKQKCH